MVATCQNKNRLQCIWVVLHQQPLGERTPGLLQRFDLRFFRCNALAFFGRHALLGFVLVDLFRLPSDDRVDYCRDHFIGSLDGFVDALIVLPNGLLFVN